MRGVAVLVFAISALLVAAVAATVEGQFSAAAGGGVAIGGDGPILRLEGDGLLRGATGRARLGLLVLPDDAAAARGIAKALASTGTHATFALTAATVWRDPELARELSGAGHEIALAGLGRADDALLPEAAWRAATTLAIRSLEGAAGHTVRVYAPARLERPALDGPAAELARRAIDLGLIVSVPSDAEARGLDGLAVVRAVADVGEALVRAKSGLTPVTVGTLAGGGEPASVGPLSIATGAALAVVARTLVAAADLIGLLGTLAVVLLVARLIGIMLAIGLPRRRGAFPEWPVRVAVLVPAHNEERGVGAAIASLRASDLPDLEIVVVDDGSTDGTAEAARAAGADDPRVLVLEQANGGKAAAIRRAFDRTTTPIIVVVDADSIVEPGTLRRLVAPFADPRIGAVAGNVKVGNRRGLLGPLQHLEYVMGINLDRRFYDRLNAITVVPGALGAFRRAAITAAGGFADETLAEDADLTLAIAGLGYRIVHAPDACVWTEAPGDWASLYRQRFRWAYGMLQVLWKHRGLARSRRATNAGRLGLPFVLLFGFALPLLAPVVDVGLLLGLITAHRTDLVLPFVLFNALQLLSAVLALRLDGEPVAHALIVPLYQLGYRQLMSFVVLRSIVAALIGAPVGWGRIRRHGLSARPA